MTWLFIAVAGGLGAAARLLVDTLVTASLRSMAPWGTWVVNVSGSFAAGLLSGVVTTSSIGGATAVVIAGGFLGAYTTFSTAMVRAVEQLIERRLAAGALNLIGSLVSCVAAAGLGMAITGR